MKNVLFVTFAISAVLLFLVPECKNSSKPKGAFASEKVDSVYLWLCNMQMDNGLLKSSEGGRYVSLYDNSLAALVFTAYGDLAKAEKIFDFFESRIELEFNVSPGGFGQLRTADGIPVENRPRRWLGDNAWLLIALNNYHHQTQSFRYQKLTVALTNWILSLQDLDGGLWGGFDEKGRRISKIAEGNLDAFNAIEGYTDFHRRLLGYFDRERWDHHEKVLIAWAENPRYRYALDLFSWGYCIFEDFPGNTLQKANRFLTRKRSTVTGHVVHGYCFDEDKDVVWLEGTGQMAVAFVKGGKEKDAQNCLSAMDKNKIASRMFENAYGFPYASNPGSSFGDDPLWDGADTNIALSSTAWYLFAKLRFDPLKLGYPKGIPRAARFWAN